MNKLGSVLSLLLCALALHFLEWPTCSGIMVVLACLDAIFEPTNPRTKDKR